MPHQNRGQRPTGALALILLPTAVQTLGAGGRVPPPPEPPRPKRWDPPRRPVDRAARCSAAGAVALLLAGAVLSPPAAVDGARAAAEGSPAAATAPERVWYLPNGDVSLPDPLAFPGLDRRLTGPRLLGSGGGGAVFALSPEGSGDGGVGGGEGEGDGDGAEVAIKVSWVRSAPSVSRECDVLRTMERRRVSGVERCLARAGYARDSRRVMIALTPVAGDAVASVEGMDMALRPRAAGEIARTMVQMLAAGVVTVDVQPLISRETGKVLFIDMTEARVLSSPPTFLDVATAGNFVGEMLGLIPDSLAETSSAALLEELKAVEARGNALPEELCDMLRGQTSLVTGEALDYLDACCSSGS